MGQVQKSRVAQFTKTLLDLGWYMGLTVCVLYVIVLVMSAIIQNEMSLKTIYMLSGLRIGFSIEGVLSSLHMMELDGTEVAVIRGAFIPFWIGKGGVLVWLGVVASLIQFALALFLLFTLRRFVQTIIDGAPFVHQNKVRLRNIGLSIVLAFVALLSVAFIHENTFLSMVEKDAIKLLGAESMELIGSEPTVAPIWMFIAGLLCLVIAEAFRYGQDLQVEQDLTV